jgi:hypothetical protein
MAHLINVDPSRGLVASIIHLKARTTIPAHYHEGFAEAHYVLGATSPTTARNSVQAASSPMRPGSCMARTRPGTAAAC